MKTTNQVGFYSTTPCDECGGPTLDLRGGSIWCANEDAHPGGHFVKRVAFERSPLHKNFRDRLVDSKPAHAITGKPIKTPKPEPKPAFSGGMDDFVRSDKA